MDLLELVEKGSGRGGRDPGLEQQQERQPRQAEVYKSATLDGRHLSRCLKPVSVRLSTLLLRTSGATRGFLYMKRPRAERLTLLVPIYRPGHLWHVLPSLR